MYKTIWLIFEENETTKQFTLYHFGKTPHFPTWYTKEGHVYEIEMIFNLKLVNTFEIFIKCLFKNYTIANSELTKI